MNEIGQLKSTDLDLLRQADVATHGVRLPAGRARDRLRLLGLIIGRKPRAGHGKSWICTAAGRDLLRRS
jgi:hypothetical protein